MRPIRPGHHPSGRNVTARSGSGCGGRGPALPSLAVGPMCCRGGRPRGLPSTTDVRLRAETESGDG